MRFGASWSDLWLEPLPFAVVAAISLFGLVHPLGVVPAATQLGAGRELAEQRRLARVASMVASGALLTALAVGAILFRVLGLAWPVLEGAGALNLFLGSMELFRGQRTAQMHDLSASKRPSGPKAGDRAVRPLGIPMLAGVSAMLHVVVLSSVSPTGPGLLAVASAVLVVLLASWWILGRAAAGRAPGTPRTRLLVSRMLAALLIPLAFELLAHGLRRADLLLLGPPSSG